jgi:hypothetical protein
MHVCRPYKLSLISVLSSVGAWTFRTMISYQWPHSIMYDILLLTHFTHLNCWYDSLVVKKPAPNLWFVFPLPMKDCILTCWFSVTFVSSTCMPTKSNVYWYFFNNCPEQPCPMQTSYITYTDYNAHIFVSLDHLFKKSIQVWGHLSHFVNKIIFYSEQLLVPP